MRACRVVGGLRGRRDGLGRHLLRVAEPDEGLRDLGEKEVIALIAYLQRLGTDISKTPAPAAVPDGAVDAEPVAQGEEAGQ